MNRIDKYKLLKRRYFFKSKKESSQVRTEIDKIIKVLNKLIDGTYMIKDARTRLIQYRDAVNMQYIRVLDYYDQILKDLS